MRQLAWFRRLRPVRPRKPSKTSGPAGTFVLTATGLFFVAFLLGFYLFFPLDSLTDRIVLEVRERTQTRLTIGHLTLTPFLALSANDLDIQRDDLPFPLVINSMRLSPQWTTLFSEDLGVHIDAKLMGGFVTAEIQKNGQFFTEARDLNLEIPIQKPVPMKIVGALKQASFNGATRFTPETATQLNMRLSDVKVYPDKALGAGLDGIALGEISLDLEGRGRSVQIKSVDVSQGDFGIQGSGRLIIGPTMLASRINLALQIKPAPSADQTLIELLKLTGTPEDDNGFRMRLSGSLAQPVIK